MTNEVSLWELLVPCVMGDNNKPCRLKHHEQFDQYVRKISKGLTILKPVKGQWIDESTENLFKERMIPVRIKCSLRQLHKIMDFAKKHYRQIAIFAYKISDEVIIR